MFLLAKLKSSLSKSYVHHYDLVNSYKISVSQLTTDIILNVVVVGNSYHNATGVTSGVGTPHPSGTYEFTPEFSGVLLARSSDFSIVFCRPLFVLFLLVIVLSVLLEIIDSGYPVWYLQTLINKEKIYFTTTCFYFIIHSAFPVSALTWFIGYICY